MIKLSFLLAVTIACSMTGCKQKTPQQQEPETEQRQTVVAYKLYPTTNMWTFIKLDTRNGKMWQVQYSVDGEDYRFETSLNSKPLIPNGGEPGRFELYPTQNMYNFLLLDGEEGNTWQVQWSAEPENRTVIPIK